MTDHASGDFSSIFEKIRCALCHGSGDVSARLRNLLKPGQTIPCPVCNGQGYIPHTAA